MATTRRGPWGRIGLVLLSLGGLVLAVTHAGCGSSSAGSAPTGGPTLGAARAVTLNLVNNCPEGIQVLVNTTGAWMSGGHARCGPGQQCAVAPGSYLLDAGSSGLDFFVGSSVDRATKAEITNLTQLSFDISVITTSGNCPNTCTSSACCDQAFNRAVRITPDAGCRCLSCDGVGCADAFHFPTDNSKQTNCTTSTTLTVEFCPASATCPDPGWRPCDAAEMAICRNLADQPCTGDLTVCCPRPAFGGSHTCYSETGTPYAHPPDQYSPCGLVHANYCYVSN